MSSDGPEDVVQQLGARARAALALAARTLLRAEAQGLAEADLPAAPRHDQTNPRSHGKTTL